MKRLLAIMMTLMFLISISGCGEATDNNQSQTEEKANQSNEEKETKSETEAEASKEKVTLEFAIKEDGATLEAYKSIIESYNESNDRITVEIESFGKDYGSIMRALMASNDLPDLFTTHGWAVHLYGEYLMPLNDQPWVSELNEQIVPTMTDLDGNIVALPFDIDITGVIVNKDVLDAVGLDIPSSLKEMEEQFETIKQAGYTPVGLGGKNASDIAGFIGRVALPILVTSSEQNHAEAFYDGSFDWSKFDEVGNFLLSAKKNGYLNVDSLTGDKDVVYAGLATNKIAYAFQSNATIVEVKKLNEDANVDVYPVPGYTEKDKGVLVSGERNAAGIWKDTEHPEEAIDFLNYLAKPENVKLISESYGLPASMDSVTSEDPFINSLLKKLAIAEVTNHFDREYLPNGMWGTLKEYGGAVLSEAMSIEEARELMESEYNRLKND